jgi:hypothetical protein
MDNAPVLLGDSIFRRLYKRDPSLFSDLSDRFCVSGQKAHELLDLISDSRQLLRGKRVIVLIGTNNICGKVKTPLESLKVKLKAIVKLLRRVKCTVTLCEVLPIPRLGRLVSDSPLVLAINAYIRTFEPSGVNVIHSHDVFCTGANIKCFLFCSKLGHSGRVDLVHPNKEGLAVLLLTLEV